MFFENDGVHMVRVQQHRVLAHLANTIIVVREGCRGCDPVSLEKFKISKKQHCGYVLMS